MMSSYFLTIRQSSQCILVLLEIDLLLLSSHHFTGVWTKVFVI